MEQSGKDIFAICEFETPAQVAPEALKVYLGSGMPVNVVMGDLRDDCGEKLAKSGLLHIICANASSETEELAQELISIVFQFGGVWNMLDAQNKTPGCICWDKQLLGLYESFVQAGVRSELILKSLEDFKESDSESETVEDTGADVCQDTFLSAKLEYKNDQLQTPAHDGVMMEWERPIMKESACLLTKKEGSVLNIGFGMGIFDSFVQEAGPPSEHYIVEAHPDVLKELYAREWDKKPGVKIIEGRWKDALPTLVSEGVTFDGIYYDTFSEHYTDLVEFFDFVCALLKMDGVFSFFNGLGADRQVCYDVYKRIVEHDLKNYGFNVEFKKMPVDLPESTWEGVKRSYFSVDTYLLPVVRFPSL